MSPNRLLPDIVRANFENLELLIRYPNGTRPWQHVLDPLLGYIAAVSEHAHNKSSESVAYNFGPNQRSLSVNQVIEIAENHWKKKLNVIINADQTQVYEAMLLDLDSTLASQNLGWHPVWSQEDAIVRTLSWWDSVESGNESPLEACFRDIDYILSSNKT